MAQVRRRDWWLAFTGGAVAALVGWTVVVNRQLKRGDHSTGFGERRALV